MITKELVVIDNNVVMTDSRTIAESFDKQHKRVMQTIRELECSDEFAQHNFVLCSYIDKNMWSGFGSSWG